MKKLLVTAALCFAVVGAYAQGKVNFSTFNFAPATNASTGQLVPTGNGYWVDLFYGGASATEDQLVSISNAPVHFSVAGYVLNANPYYTDPARVAGGAAGKFQIRAWEAALGDNWATALANWQSGGAFAGKVLGKSNIATITVADALAVPPPTPTGLGGANGIRGFALVAVPEPGVLVLGLLGLVALAWRRRN